MTYVWPWPRSDPCLTVTWPRSSSMPWDPHRECLVGLQPGMWTGMLGAETRLSADVGSLRQWCRITCGLLPPSCPSDLSHEVNWIKVKDNHTFRHPSIINLNHFISHQNKTGLQQSEEITFLALPRPNVIFNRPLSIKNTSPGIICHFFVHNVFKWILQLVLL